MKSPDPDREERIRRIEERLAKGIPDAKPKPVAVLTVPITDKLAEAIRANPALPPGFGEAVPDPAFV
jgi:hypothetical protein